MVISHFQCLVRQALAPPLAKYYKICASFVFKARIVSSRKSLQAVPLASPHTNALTCAHMRAMAGKVRHLFFPVGLVRHLRRQFPPRVDRCALRRLLFSRPTHAWTHVYLSVTLTARFGRLLLVAVQATDVAAALPRSQDSISLYGFEISMVGQATTANDDTF